jgi:exodeoxyribonuclease V alpha subunit
MNPTIINHFYSEGLLAEIDIFFARFMTNLAEDDDPDLFLAAALVSRACGNGDICFDLPSVSGKIILEKEDRKKSVSYPVLENWHNKLVSSPVVGRPGEKCPLILDYKNRLYLYRYWEYEKKLVDSIKQRIRQQPIDLDLSLLKDGIKRFFPENTDTSINWQKIAVATALLKQFCVISGGPGTGKTFTVVKILALLTEQAPQTRYQILLAAPTGKAAAKLTESLKNAKVYLNCSDAVKDAIPQKAFTIHRMLKIRRGSPYFHFNRENPLPANVVIIDEASMVDLALMSKLVQALPDTAKLVLIGDKDQLASVEAGAVLGDICDRNNIHGFSLNFCKQINELTGGSISPSNEKGKNESGLHNCIVNLVKSYRFAEDSSIGSLSRAVNLGDYKKALNLFKAGNGQISMKTIRSSNDLYRTLKDKIIIGYTEYLKTSEPNRAIEQFNRFRLLCALKIGPFGVNAINRLTEQILFQEKLIQMNPLNDNPWYRGRPVLITSNDYYLGLFNGDIGITLPDPGSGRNDLYVFFSRDSGDLRRFSPYILPEHETAYASTVHKSQGSEFENTVLILPNRDYPVLTRELIYTAITRARKSIWVLGNEAVIQAAIKHKIERTSGLRDALWEMGSKF